MQKTEFVSLLASRYNLNAREAQKWLDAALDSIEDALSIDGRAPLPGFGVLAVVERKSREGRDPRDGAKIVIPARRVVRFTTSAVFKALINDPLYASILRK